MQYNHNCSTLRVSQQVCSSSGLCTAGGVRAASITNPLTPLCVLHLAELRWEANTSTPAQFFKRHCVFTSFYNAF